MEQRARKTQALEALTHLRPLLRARRNHKKYLQNGFFSGLLVLIPLIHGRAVRLTTRRLEAALPESMAEVQAEKDLLRAEFAMSTRRLEMTVEQLMNKTTNQVVELSKKDAIINRLKVERDAQHIEIITLKTQVEALNERPNTIYNQPELRGDCDPEEVVKGLSELLREPRLNGLGPSAAEIGTAIAPDKDAKQLVSEVAR